MSTQKIKKIFTVREKLACVTLDFEKDYGDRIEQFNILTEKRKLQELAGLFKRLKVPVSSFIRTDVLVEYPQGLEIIKMIAQDYHSHSHTHNTRSFQSKKEISESVKVFTRYFGHKPLGYRAPMGVLYRDDIAIIKEEGFAFSSSVFPSYRPAKFNNLSLPLTPFIYENGIVELPFAVVPRLRYTISLSYLKLLGFAFNRLLFSTFGLPNVVVFDSHLHDYIVNAESFSRLPGHLRWAWGVNKHSGVKYFTAFVHFLRQKGYNFITMTELYNRLQDDCR